MRGRMLLRLELGRTLRLQPSTMFFQRTKALHISLKVDKSTEIKNCQGGDLMAGVEERT